MSAAELVNTEIPRDRFTSRIEAYVQIWRQRCYQDSIPDELPDGLLFSGRAPSWKAIAVCVLRNNFRLHKLGYTTTPGEWAQVVIEMSTRETCDQMRLF